MYEIKILRSRSTPLFCTHTLRSSLECEIGTAMDPFREKNNNVKLACHEIYQGRYYLLIFFSFSSKYLFSAVILSIKYFSVYWHNDRSVAQEAVSFFWISPQILARDDGWKTLKLHKLQQIMFVLFEIYIQNLIIRTESWFWSFH